MLQRGLQLRPSVREPVDLGERPGYVAAGLGERRIERRCRTHQRHRGADHVPWLEEAQILAMPMDAYLPRIAIQTDGTGCPSLISVSPAAASFQAPTITRATKSRGVSEWKPIS